MNDDASMNGSQAGNVLLITADQWRWDFCSGSGFPQQTTPAIDQLAAQATCFDRHFANATPCGPSRACLLTGMYAHNHRSVQNGTPLDGSFTNLALEARQAGYTPELFGYTDTSADPRGRDASDPALTTYEGVMPGFDPVCLFIENNRPWLSFLESKGYDVPGPGYAICAPLVADEPSSPTRQPARYRAEHSDTAWLVDQCISHLHRLKSEPRDKPFFVHLSLLRPHPPWIAPAPYNTMFNAMDMPAVRRPPDCSEKAAQHPFLDWQLGRIPQQAYFERGEGLASDLDEHQVAQIRATYAGLLREVDDNLSRLFSALKELGFYDETLIVVTSDHGEQLGDHFLFGKLGFFDESYRIPLIVRDPRQPSGHGKRVEAFTESVDLMPTILSWIGLEAPGQCDGLALDPWLDGESPADWRDAVHWSFDFRNPQTRAGERHFDLAGDACNATVRRDGRWKYVHFAGLPPLLFDLDSDPAEAMDLAGSSGHLVERLEMAEAMLAWRHRTSYGALSNIMLTDRGPVEARRYS
ncbi:MAG: alkaline phosphatase family protein [Pseudomonadota bacterium]